jgi:Family of unknown function (DUF5343)
VRPKGPYPQDLSPWPLYGKLTQKRSIPPEDLVAQTLPYLASNKNIGELFKKILSAKKPEAFTHAFLKDTIGLKGSNDRALISLLKALGFLDPGGRPTPGYDLLKNQNEAKLAVAGGIRRAYQPLFDSNEAANELSPEALKGLISRVAGTDEEMTARIASTFQAIAKIADFNRRGVSRTSEQTDDEAGEEEADEIKRSDGQGGLRPDFHYNIQIHLPANGSEETYLNIFNAIRKTFK